jgi:hypothetical protein
VITAQTVVSWSSKSANASPNYRGTPSTILVLSQTSRQYHSLHSFDGVSRAALRRALLGRPAMELFASPLRIRRKGLINMKTLLAVAVFLPLLAGAQALENIKSQAELDKAITTLDAALFDAYNRCDLEKFSTFFTADVEFYHDQGGVTLGNAKLTESIKQNICGGDVRRELVPGSLQVHYMKGYGAVEIGVHRFLHPKSNSPTGEGRFINLWQYKDGAWKITRAISFDHRDVAK